MMKEGYCQILLRSLKNSFPGNNKIALCCSRKGTKLVYSPPPPCLSPRKIISLEICLQMASRKEIIYFHHTVYLLGLMRLLALRDLMMTVHLFLVLGCRKRSTRNGQWQLFHSCWQMEWSLVFLCELNTLLDCVHMSMHVKLC